MPHNTIGQYYIKTSKFGVQKYVGYIKEINYVPWPKTISIQNKDHMSLCLSGKMIDPTSKKSADSILKEQIHVRKKHHDSQYFQYLNFCLCYRTTFRPIVSSWESPYGHPTTGPLMIWKLDNPTSRTSPCLVNCLEMRSSIN